MLSAAAPISFAVAFALVSAALPFAFALVVCDFWMVSQQMSPDFDMVPGVLGGFPRVLFAAGIADLGKRRRPAAFKADSACKTAQKLSVGLACDMPCHAIGEQPVIPLRERWRAIPPTRLPRL